MLFRSVNESEVENKISSYGSSLSGRVIYIPIGSSANDFNGSSFKTLKATNGAEILNQVKAATEYIYDGRVKREVSDSTLNLGVSMRKMIIFAQGAGVEISGVSKGKITDNISVKYTETSDAVNYNGGKVSFSSNEDKIVTDNSLQGVVATVEPTGDCIDPGQFDITFGDAKPQSYTIYYEPAVKACYSLEKDGVEYLSSDAQTSEGSLNPGTYKLTAYIGDAYQKSDKGKPIDVSAAEEIQDISFDVVLTGSGVVGGRQEFSYDQLKNGADVKLQRGDIECNAEATIQLLLTYSHLSYLQPFQHIFPYLLLTYLSNLSQHACLLLLQAVPFLQIYAFLLHGVPAFLGYFGGVSFIFFMIRML